MVGEGQELRGDIEKVVGEVEKVLEEGDEWTVVKGR